MKRYIKASEETRYNMTLSELISFLDDIKYDIKPNDDYMLATGDDALIVDIFWAAPSLNVSWYPIVQIDHNNKTIFNREGTENPGNWYKVIDEAINRYIDNFCK